jgi:hypothetical protein
MPAPRGRNITPERIAERVVLARRAVEAGAIQQRDKLLHAEKLVGSVTSIEALKLRFEPICFGTQGCVHPVTFQPTTPEAWVADCRERGVIPTVPNL